MALSSQFNQHFFEQLLCRYFCAKKLQSQLIIRKKLDKALLYKKGAHKMSMKLTQGWTTLIYRPFIYALF